MPKASKTAAKRACEGPGASSDLSATYVSGFVTRGLLVGFARLGLTPEQICAPLGWSPSELMDPAARVPSAAFWSLWREAERLSGDPSLGLRLAQAIPLAAAGGIVGQLAGVSETGLDGVRHLARYDKLYADRLGIELREDEFILSIEFGLAGGDDALARHVYEALLGGFWRILDAAMLEGLVPARVSFRHSPPPNVEPYERFFGCPIVFRAPTYCLRFTLVSLRRPMISAQTRAESRLQDLVESQLRAIAPELTVAVSEQVRAAIEDQQRPTQASIARRLGIGQRTLQRRLREEGSSFRMIGDRERKSLALALLGQPGRRVLDIAQDLGFNDATSFAKAFRRWTGESPTAYRARAVHPKL